MTKTSIYCYEKNGGACKNKVSSANNFVCSAGHGGASHDICATSAKRTMPLEAASQEVFLFRGRTLSEMPHYSKKILAEDRFTPPETLAKLGNDGDWSICHSIAENISTPLETYISLAERSYVPLGFTKNKPIDDLIKDIHLVDQYPDTFSVAYLDRLAGHPLPGDRTHPKRRALIGYVYGKYVESDRNSKWVKREYKDKIQTLFPNDQELAEMVGY